MRISFNASAVLANNSLLRADNRLSDSLGRLSSGLKVVNAKDNPSGLAMGKRMNAQIEGVKIAFADAAVSGGKAVNRALQHIGNGVFQSAELYIMKHGNSLSYRSFGHRMSL